MPFQELPTRLRLYILAHLVLVPPVLFVVLRLPQPSDAWLVGALVLFTLLFSTWKLELTVCEGRMTPVYATVCLAMLLQGAQAALLCSAVGALVTTFIRPPKASWKVEFLRPRLYYVWFNLANTTLAAAAAALAFAAVYPHAPHKGMDALLALTAFTSVYFLINTFGVALAVSLQQSLPFLPTWQQNFLWTGPGFFASAGAAAGIQGAFSWVGAWSLLFLPPLYLIYYSYRLYLERLRRYAEQVQQDTARIQQLSTLNHALVTSLSRSVEGNPSAPARSLQRLQSYALTLAKAAGMAEPERELLSTAAMLSDVGSLGTLEGRADRPPSSCHHDETAPAATGEAAGEHPASGGTKPVVLAAGSALAELVLTQHERWDGRGYPRRLAGERIPLGGRILAIVGMFDLLTTDRGYRRAMSQEEALTILKGGAGKQFDARLVALFEQALTQISTEVEPLAAVAGGR
jgi:hypothetical protein